MVSNEEEIGSDPDKKSRSTNVTRPPEQRKTRRLHGLQLPLHPQQIAGWFVLLFLSIGFIVQVLPRLNPPFRQVLTILVALILTIHVVAHITALILDPAALQVRKQPSNVVIPEFDRSKHLHVIENGRCHLCNITTSSKRTKHCSVCNKCVDNFDHHCMWLNNCIGGRNYSFFIICIVSAILSALVAAVLSFVEIAASVEAKWNFQNMTMDNMTLPISLVQDTNSLVVISIVGILSAVAAALLIHLCFFHGYIACMGLTTYEYVRNKREENAAENSLQIQNQMKKNRQFLCLNDLSSNYHFCKNVSNNEMENETNQVYICSTTSSDETSNSQPKGKRNFHLYFSYETRADATSIELSSQSILENTQRPSIEAVEIKENGELKPSTPSPVSCCFSIMNHHNWSERRKKTKNNNLTNIEGDEKPVTRCTTVRRIQTFFRSRLRKNARQRALDSTRTRKNRITPVQSPDENEKESQLPIVLPKDGLPQVQVALVPQRPPVKLPPLNLTEDIIHENTIFTVPIVKRNPQQLRIRRPSFNRRPRFKMSPHITQSAQLSPIPESEFSKPTSPRSPPKLKHFTFPDYN